MKKNNFHGKTSTSYDEKSANSSRANISHSRQEGRLVSSITAVNQRLRNSAFVSHWSNIWIRILNIQIFNGSKIYGQRAADNKYDVFGQHDENAAKANAWLTSFAALFP